MASNYGIIDLVEEAAREGYGLVGFTIKSVMGFTGVNSLVAALDSYGAFRFQERLKDFAFAEENVSQEKFKEFYDGLRSNSKHMNYIYAMFECAMKSAFDINAKIASYLYRELIQKGELNYQEMSLLSNLLSLSENDYRNYFDLMCVVKNINDSSDIYIISNRTNEQEVSLKKFILIGIIIEDRRSYAGEENIREPIRFYKSEYADKFMIILNSVLDKK